MWNECGSTCGLGMRPMNLAIKSYGKNSLSTFWHKSTIIITWARNKPFSKVVPRYLSMRTARSIIPISLRTAIILDHVGRSEVFPASHSLKTTMMVPAGLWLWETDCGRDNFSIISRCLGANSRQRLMLATAARRTIALMLKQPPGKWTSGYKQDKNHTHKNRGITECN